MDLREFIEGGNRVGRGILRFFVTAFLLAILTRVAIGGIPLSETANMFIGITLLTISLLNAVVMDWRDEGYSRFSLRTMLFVAVPIVAVFSLLIFFMSRSHDERVVHDVPWAYQRDARFGTVMDELTYLLLDAGWSEIPIEPNEEGDVVRRFKRTDGACTTSIEIIGVGQVLSARVIYEEPDAERCRDDVVAPHENILADYLEIAANIEGSGDTSSARVSPPPNPPLPSPPRRGEGANP